MIPLLAVGMYIYPSSKSGNRDVLLNPDKPGVFISFEKTGPREPRSAGESNNGVWLVLHNNYAFPILIPANGSDRSGEVGVIYYVEDSPDGNSESKHVRRRHSDVFSMPQLDPGKEMLFSLASEELSASESLRVRFEIGQEGSAPMGGPPPLHYAVFYGSLLPRK